MTAAPRRLLVVEHQPDAPAGLVAAWAQERDVAVQTFRTLAPDRVWPAPGEHDAVVALGSDCSVERSPDAWIAEEVAFLRATHAHGVPVLGLCFGAQSLATALGATVTRAAHDEIGWFGFPEASDERFAGPFFAWHSDAFTVPPGAQELARSSAGAQAFRSGASVGVQFHPEVDGRIVDMWLDWGRSRLVDARLDEDAIRAETAELLPGARRRAFAVFDLWAESWLAPAIGHPSTAGS